MSPSRTSLLALATALSALVVAWVALGSRPPARPAPAPSAKARSPASASASAGPASTEDSAPGESPASECSDEASDAHLQEALDGDSPGEIRRELDAAIRSAPLAGPPRALLARRLRGEGKLKEAAAEAWMALALEQHEAALWAILAEQAEKSGGHDEARAYRARASALDDTGGSKPALGSRSTCTGARFVPDKGRSIEIVTGWQGIFAFVASQQLHGGEPAGPPPRSDAEARQRLCVVEPGHSDSGKDTCGKEYPWMFHAGEQNFHTHFVSAAPLSGGRFIVVPSREGNSCTGGGTSQPVVHGDVIEVVGTEVGVLRPTRLEGACPVPDSPSGVCVTFTQHRRTFYDARTGRALLVVVDLEDKATFSLKGYQLSIQGPEGCNDTIDLKTLPIDLGAEPSE